MATPAAPPAPLDPAKVVRSRAYLSALVLAAVLGIPISAVAYGFLALTGVIQTFLFTDLPGALFPHGAPAWWPVPWLALCGVLTGATIRTLPGNAGHSPAFGFVTGGGPPVDRELPGIVLASLATLCLGAVLGPEAPLIAIGGGLAALVVRRVRRGAPPMAITMMASAGSFAAISALLGSPVLGAFLIMEAAGISGTTLSLVALPGLLASGVGAVVFLGLDRWTGLGTFSLVLPTVPPLVDPTIATMGWALAMGAAGAGVGWLIRALSLRLRPLVHRNRVIVTAILGLVIGATAGVYQLSTGRTATEVLFSGQSGLPAVVAHAAELPLGVLLALALAKTVAYSLSLTAFRGGPVFPSIFLGAVLGIAASSLPGMSLAPAIGIGIAAMCTAMLRLPMTSTLLATLLLGADGLAVAPEAVVAVAAAYVVTIALPDPGPKHGGILSRAPAAHAPSVPPD